MHFKGFREFSKKQNLLVLSLLCIIQRFNLMRVVNGKNIYMIEVLGEPGVESPLLVGEAEVEGDGESWGA